MVASVRQTRTYETVFTSRKLMKIYVERRKEGRRTRKKKKNFSPSTLNEASQRAKQKQSIFFTIFFFRARCMQLGAW